MFISLRDLNVHVRIDGPPGAPVLLLLHSLGTSSDIWDGMISQLSSAFRVIRPDMRGHGLSDVSKGPYSIDQLANDAFSILKALSVQKAYIGGVSIGGLIAQKMALLEPERVLRLFLIDTASVFPSSASWLERAHDVRLHGLKRMADDVLNRWITTPGLKTPEAKGLRQIFLRTDPEGYASACEALSSCDLTQELHGITVPTLVIVGEQDTATPVSVARKLRESLPDGQLKIVPQASHIPTMEQPKAITTAMLSFLMGSDHNNIPPDLYARGMDVRRAVLGNSHVDRSTAAITPFDQDFQTFITRTAWGQVWSRAQFDRRTRSIVTLALLAGLGCEEEFALHVHASRNTGCSDEDIAELLLHVAVYAGIPKANSAIRCAKNILKEHHKKE